MLDSDYLTQALCKIAYLAINQKITGWQPADFDVVDRLRVNVVTQSQTSIFFTMQSVQMACNWKSESGCHKHWNHQTATDYSQFQGGLCPFSSVTELLGRIISACRSIQTHRCVVHVKMRDDGCGPTQECRVKVLLQWKVTLLCPHCWFYPFILPSIHYLKPLLWLESVIKFEITVSGRLSTHWV